MIRLIKILPFFFIGNVIGLMPKKLPNGKYKVFINSKFIKGKLDISHALLKGKYKKEIFHNKISFL